MTEERSWRGSSAVVNTDVAMFAQAPCGEAILDQMKSDGSIKSAGERPRDAFPEATESVVRETAEACARSLLRHLRDVSVPGIVCASSADRPTLPTDDERRATVDSASARAACHDPLLHRHLRPLDGQAAHLFDVLERLRYEALVARRFPGVRLNLTRRDRTAVKQSRSVSDAATDRLARMLEHRSVSAFVEAASRGVEEPYAGDGLPLPSEASATDALQRDLTGLARSLDQQGRYARESIRLIEALLGRVVSEWASEPPLLDETLPSNADGSPDSESDDTPDEATEADACEQHPDESANATVAAEAHGDASPVDEAQQDASGIQVASGDADASAVDDPAATTAGGPLPGLSLSSPVAYRVFDRQHDQVAHARQLAEPARLLVWRQQLDRAVQGQARETSRLARRLNQILLARQRRLWLGDQEEGELDTARLSRRVIEPMHPLTHRRANDLPFSDTVVTLLIDNSRSMVGRPILTAALTADLLARTLEHAGVAVEILGFTTVSFHGGAVIDAWRRAGSPVAPGRLNAVRHIVYKSADTPWRRARHGLGLMLDGDLLKQNVDGEALIWARDRLLADPRERRILLVISDGLPIDIATDANNPGSLLADHLRQVIGDIERRGSIELLAIGIGHDVSRFYRRSAELRDARELGPAVFREIEQLFRGRRAR